MKKNANVRTNNKQFDSEIFWKIHRAISSEADNSTLNNFTSVNNKPPV